MHFTLVSPRIGIQKGDFLGSGVPYWPIELATLAAFLRNRGHSVNLFDMFGSDPWQLEEKEDHYLQGKPAFELISSSALRESDAVLIYALSYMSHGEILQLCERIREHLPNLFIGIVENSQAVTAYALPHSAKSFFSNGASALLCGELYWNWDDVEEIIAGRRTESCNVITAHSSEPYSVRRQFNRTPSLPVPAWDLINLENYWSLPYSHGPKTKKFLPILTSRGCPYPCDFCVVPETNDRLWRARSASEVVDEMCTLRDRFGVHDFQIEDLNPTVRGKRTDEICNLLIACKANVRFYIVSGTKAETVKISSVPLLAKAGCRYISISPESGSEIVMKAIGKPFDYKHGLELVSECRKHGIRTQACFIVGHPKETDADHARSVNYLRKMVRHGLDEVAVFIVAPFAGSKLYQSKKIEMNADDAFVSFSPKGRANWRTLTSRRQQLIRLFFMEKLKKGFDLWAQGWRALFGVPATKMENLPKRIIFVYLLLLRHGLKKRFASETVLPSIEISKLREEH